jgi:hypothetical protein
MSTAMWRRQRLWPGRRQAIRERSAAEKLATEQRQALLDEVDDEFARRR